MQELQKRRRGGQPPSWLCSWQMRRKRPLPCVLYDCLINGNSLRQELHRREEKRPAAKLARQLADAQEAAARAEAWAADATAARQESKQQVRHYWCAIVEKSHRN